MKVRHTPFHWVAVALVSAVALLTLSEAGGQATSAGALFEGRPALAGAQGGQGAQAGVPQGGLGVQGSEAERGVLLGKPSGLDALPPAPRDPGLDPVSVSGKDAVKKKESGLARDQRSSVRKAKRAARRTIERARHGSAPIDSRTAPRNN